MNKFTRIFALFFVMSCLLFNFTYANPPMDTVAIDDLPCFSAFVSDFPNRTNILPWNSKGTTQLITKLHMRQGYVVVMKRRKHPGNISGGDFYCNHTVKRLPQIHTLPPAKLNRINMS